MIYIPSPVKIGSGIRKMIGVHIDSMVISWTYFHLIKIRKQAKNHGLYYFHSVFATFCTDSKLKLWNKSYSRVNENWKISS
jgi:hypothetical protein